MNNSVAATAGAGPDAEFLARIKGTNINQQTLLATDYLNHFNEVVMLIEMIPDMVECLEDARAWAPKTYPQHFLDSSLSEGELAAQAYDMVPACYRIPFERTIDQLNQLVGHSLSRTEAALAAGATDAVTHAAQSASRALQRLIEVACGTIHGSAETLAQQEVDSLLAVV